MTPRMKLHFGVLVAGPHRFLSGAPRRVCHGSRHTTCQAALAVSTRSAAIFRPVPRLRLPAGVKGGRRPSACRRASPLTPAGRRRGSGIRGMAPTGPSALLARTTSHRRFRCGPPRRPMPAGGRQQAERVRARCAALARRLDPREIPIRQYDQHIGAGRRRGRARGTSLTRRNVGFRSSAGHVSARIRHARPVILKSGEQIKEASTASPCPSRPGETPSPPAGGRPCLVASVRGGEAGGLRPASRRTPVQGG
jgi:hypothetical protein